MMLALALAAALGVTTLDGRPVDVWRHDTSDGRPPTADRRAVVLVFIRHDCPVSNRYVPELNRLYDAYRASGVRMYVVYSGAASSRETLRAHHAEYDLRVPALVDADLALADLAGATMTPEAAVFVPPFPDQSPKSKAQRSKTKDQRPETKDQRRVSPIPAPVYLGRVDDRAAGPGLWRPAAAVRDLDDVLARITRGERVALSRTRAYGCYLRSLSH